MDVRAYYYNRLEEFADGEPGAEGDAWITMEDINVERLIALDLRGHENMRTSCEACVCFTKLLMYTAQTAIMQKTGISNLLWVEPH